MKILSQIYNDINSLTKNREFMPTGIFQLDEFLDGGFMRKELIVIGGQTGSGKSFLSCQIFHNISKKCFKCAYFSLEISNEMLVSRLIGQLSNIKPTKIMCGLLNEEENQSKIKAKAQLSVYEEFMNFSDETYKIEEIEKLIEINKYDFIVVDFIQNVMTKQKDEYSSMSYASLQFQNMAKKYNCCIVLVSQLSNSASNNGKLEYKGSGGIAMVADLGFFVIPQENQGDFLLELRKNRRGISGVKFNLKFKLPCGTIK